MAFVRVARSEELWDGEVLGVDANGVRVVLARSDGEVCAYLDRCAHLGVRLSEGKVEGGVLTCRAHQLKYDLRSGACLNPRSVKLVSVPVREHDRDIWLDMAEVGGARA